MPIWAFMPFNQSRAGFFFFRGGGILVLSPKICLFGGQGFFYAKILLFSSLISFEIYFTFCNRQLSSTFDACFVFSVVFPLFFLSKIKSDGHL